MRSSFAMTEPAPGGGSDPSMIKTYAEKHGDTWKIYGRKWFITGAAARVAFHPCGAHLRRQAQGHHHVPLSTRTSPAGASCAASRSWGRRSTAAIASSSSTASKCTTTTCLGGLGNGLKIVQVRLGPARLTHCMRWLGWSKRCMEIAQEYVNRREGFGIKLADRESVQMKLGEVGHNIQIGRLLTMHAAWKLDQGDFARKEVSMAKVHMANTLHQAADVAIQLQGARGYSKDTIVEWVYRAARAARLVDGADEVHKMVLAKFMREEGRDFWSWSAGNRV